MTPETDYRETLRSAWARESSGDRLISLRSFARHLGLAPSHLSLVLNGKKDLSPTRALEVADKLKLAPYEAEAFVSKVQALKVKSPALKRRLIEKSRQRGLVDLDAEKFRLVADWYHIPILELTEVANFEFTTDNVARRLEIAPLLAKSAVERLVNLDLLEIHDGKYRKTYRSGSFRSKKSQEALRSFHRQMLYRAIEALQTQGPEQRHSASFTFAVDPEQLEAARDLSRRYAEDLTELFSKGKKKSALYHLQLQLFGL